MVHGWMRRVEQCIVSRKRKKGEAPTSLLRHIGSRLHAEAGCKKVYAWKVFE